MDIQTRLLLGEFTDVSDIRMKDMRSFLSFVQDTEGDDHSKIQSILDLKADSEIRKRVRPFLQPSPDALRNRISNLLAKMNFEESEGLRSSIEDSILDLSERSVRLNKEILGLVSRHKDISKTRSPRFQKCIADLKKKVDLENK